MSNKIPLTRWPKHVQILCIPRYLNMILKVKTIWLQMFRLFTVTVEWLIGSDGSLLLRSITSSITSPEKDKNSKFLVWFLLHVHYSSHHHKFEKKNVFARTESSMMYTRSIKVWKVSSICQKGGERRQRQ